MMTDKMGADLNLAKISLSKAVSECPHYCAQEEVVKNLKGENEYYVKQLDATRKELE